jgi:hypothetical protein
MGMATVFGRPGLDWTVVLRRQPARIAVGADRDPAGRELHHGKRRERYGR